jgi:phosphoglycerate dehydrogenase-like enzyme
MRPDAFLINMTRGRVVDEQALYDALRERRIGGAAIDVWYQYPADPAEQKLPSRFPFQELDNVILSPHIAGWTRETIAGRVADIAENIRRLAAGEELLHRLR